MLIEEALSERGTRNLVQVTTESPLWNTSAPLTRSDPTSSSST
ncbi:hypothetical protein ACK03K_17340 [[Kitasatospora] papulosa]